MVNIVITIDYNLNTEEFAQLGDEYPLGEYHSTESGDTQWFSFTVTAPRSGADICRLRWFLA